MSQPNAASPPSSTTTHDSPTSDRLTLAKGQSVFYLQSTGEPIFLRHQIASGGEATLWRGRTPQELVKLYHEPSQSASSDRDRKLQFMVAHPPQQPAVSSQDSPSHIPIAWPTDLLLDADNRVQGFVMPKVARSKTLNHVYNPKLRLRHAPGFNWFYLHTTCRNIAWIMRSLHASGYVVGDVKTDNFLTTPQALVSVIDVDSFQVPKTDPRLDQKATRGGASQDPTEPSFFRCPVGSEGFTPPELIDADLTHYDRTPHHDAFGMAVIFYLMLFGYHPHSGEWQPSPGTPAVDDHPHPSRDALIKAGHWVGHPSSPLKPGPHALPLTILHPDLQALFQMAFTEGHSNPRARPLGKEWVKALETAMNALKMCDASVSHFYIPSRGCPWCHYVETRGFEPFPQPDMVHTDPFLLQKKFEKADTDGDDRELLRLWQNPAFKTLVAINDRHANRVKEAEVHQAIFERLQKSYQHHPHNDASLLDIWSKNTSFSHSIFAKEKVSSFGGEDATTIITNALTRRQTLLDMLRAARQSPPDFITVALLWEQVKHKNHPTFQDHMPTLEPLLRGYKNYKKLTALLKKQPSSQTKKKILELWDEALFTHQARRDGLLHQVHQYLKEATPSCFAFAPPTMGPSSGVHATPTGLLLRWRWHPPEANHEPQSKISTADGAFLALRFDRYPERPDDTVHPHQRYTITRDMYNANGGAWLDLGEWGDGGTHPEAEGLDDAATVYLSVWPCVFQAGRLHQAGEPLHLTPPPGPDLYCRVTKPAPSGDMLTVTLLAPRDITVPPSRLTASHHDSPTATASDTFTLKSLPSLSLKGAAALSLTCPLPTWWTEDSQIALIPQPPKGTSPKVPPPFPAVYYHTSPL